MMMDDGQLESGERDYFDAIVRGRPNSQVILVGERDDDAHSRVETMPIVIDRGYSVFQHQHARKYQQQHVLPPRSSWLCHVFWLVSSDEDSSLPQPQRVEDKNSDPMNADNEDEENSPTQDAIRSLSIQLLQVKRRLFPAAERCTEACNSLYDNNHRWTTTTTTARKEFTIARNACNPYEILTRGGGGGSSSRRNHGGGGGGGGDSAAGGLGHLFMNRAAIKLANIDAMLDFGLTTNHYHDHHHRQPDDSGAFVFVDLCGAPGGFSEYILWRCSASQNIPACRGYGMSLQGSNEYGGGE
jgi:FtsJ-like methyltransferase